MAGIREVRFTTTDGKGATVRMEYEDGVTRAILEYRLALPPPLEPAAVILQAVNLLKRLGTDLLNIEPEQIIIEWAAP